MKSKIVTILFITGILLIAGGIIFLKSYQGLVISGDAPTEEEAKWIGSHAVLYMRTSCSHCRDQEAMFGENIKYINMIDGDEPGNIQKFIDAEIEAVPTWVIDGKKYVGVKSIEKLKELTGYQD